MSISSVGASGAGNVSQLLARMLSRLDQTNADDASAFDTPATPETSSKAQPGKTQAVASRSTLSDKILGLMIMLQAKASSSTTGAAHGDAVAQTFQAMDSDGDGNVSKTEMESYVQTLGGSQAEADKLFAGLAGDSQDGISKDAFAAAAEAGRPHGPRGAHGGKHGGGAEKVFDALDTNQDGTVSSDELAAAFPSSDANTTSAQDIFAQMDGNADGGVTKDEFSSYITSLIDKARSETSLLGAFRDMAARSYNASESLLTPPTGAGQTVDA